MEEDNVEGHADPNHPAEKMETDVGVPDNTEKSDTENPRFAPL